MTSDRRPQEEPSQASGVATKPKVAVVYTTPDTVLEDIGRAMRLADYQSHLPKDLATLLKINISWQHYYPACSTSPWQLDGVIRTLQADGYGDIIPTHNGTVVVDAREGELNNKHKAVEDRHGLESVYLEEVEWVRYEPKAPMAMLDRVYPEGDPHTQDADREERGALADGEDPRIHDDHGRDEERLRRVAELQAPLDALCNPRDSRGPAQDSEGDPPGPVRRYRRHLRGRRARPPGHGGGTLRT